MNDCRRTAEKFNVDAAIYLISALLVWQIDTELIEHQQICTNTIVK